VLDVVPDLLQEGADVLIVEPVENRLTGAPGSHQAELPEDP